MARKEDHTFMQNTHCEYFPCHAGVPKEDFNCLFCFCPLYALGEDCGGNFRYMADGVKDCSDCTIPHTPGGYEHILARWPALQKLAQRPKDTEREDDSK